MTASNEDVNWEEMKPAFFFASLCTALSGVLGTSGEQNNTPINIQQVLHTRSYFYVGGSYVQSPTGSSISAEQIYVEHLAPIKVTERYPLLMIHGNGKCLFLYSVNRRDDNLIVALPHRNDRNELLEHTRWPTRMGRLLHGARV